MNEQLQSLLNERNAEFNYDGETWCLSGIENGLGWETDDFEASTQEEAEQDAINFIEGIKRDEEHDALMAASYEG